MNLILALDLQLPLDLPGPPVAVWHWAVIWGLWLLGLVLALGGIYAVFIKYDEASSYSLPGWIPVLAFVAWLIAQVLGWWIAGIAWHNIAVNSFAVGVLLALVGIVVAANGEGCGSCLLCLMAVAGLVIWLTWPRTRDGIAWISNRIPDDWAGFSFGGEEELVTIETARAELDRCLAWWKSHPGEPYLDRSQFQYMLGDLHMGTGFELKSYQIGPGREVDVGSFEFRVSMELARFRLSTGDQALFPEKTYLVAKQPPMDTWLIEDQSLLESGNVEGLIQELLPGSSGY